MIEEKINKSLKELEQGLKEIVVPPNNTCCGAFSKEF